MIGDAAHRTSTACALALACAIAAGLAAFTCASADDSAPVTIALPSDIRSFGSGPGQSVAQANCTICHAADYVYMQPPLSAAQWRAEVTKMKTAYGAPIDDSSVETLVAYLVAQNGKQ